MSDEPRLLRPDRRQVYWDRVDLDSQLPDEHLARAVWDFVAAVDVSALEAGIKSRAGGPGRPTPDRRLYVALWLYATLDGVGSARELARLCGMHTAYRWLCGGVPVNHHDLSDFRGAAGAFLDDLLSKSVAGLVAEGLVGLDCLAVDGLRVRAAAGPGSFRRKARLVELEAAAAAKVAALRAELDDDPGAATKRARARRESAATERAARLARAQRALAEIEAEREREARAQRRKKPRNKSEPRASTTDPEARIMKMPDGGFRPAYNVQLATDPASGVIVGLRATDRTSDRGQLGPAVADVERRYGRRPRRLLGDGGYDAKDDIESLHRPENGAIEVFCPIPGSRGKPVPPAPQPGEGPGVRAWRERMSTEAGVALYHRRIAAERPHADMRNRGFVRLLLRGREKANAVALWFATAHNFLQALLLRARQAAAAPA
jgi:transposase